MTAKLILLINILLITVYNKFFTKGRTKQKSYNPASIHTLYSMNTKSSYFTGTIKWTGKLDCNLNLEAVL